REPRRAHPARPGDVRRDPREGTRSRHPARATARRPTCQHEPPLRRSAMSDEAAGQQLVDMLEHVWGSIADLGSGLDEAQWKQPTDCPGWTVQDNLVHITALER